MQRSHFDIQRSCREQWLAAYRQLHESFQSLDPHAKGEFDYYFQPTFDVLTNAVINFELMDERNLRALEILLTLIDDATLLCDVRSGADHYISISYAGGEVSHQWDREAPHVRSRYVGGGRFSDICTRIGIQRPQDLAAEATAGPAPHEQAHVRSAQLKDLKRLWEANTLSEGLARTREQMARAREALKTRMSDQPDPELAVEQVIAAAAWHRLGESLMELHGCTFAWHCELDIALIDRGHAPAEMPNMFKLSDIDVQITPQDIMPQQTPDRDREGPQSEDQGPSL